ncbi:hypothetical protein N7376_15700 [Brucella intermedia GD04153]|jgi:hypothetical protein|uniref:Uncharacterized protein n=1 Tax=Brucella intermedia GD04153 TaxID=2975438 RepID=A0AA42KUD8_9HYPH|nr:hypothetical protein [Brucella intermedia]MDH0125452.1 hypothetical protein [Brucella intermedia GD04153]
MGKVVFYDEQHVAEMQSRIDAVVAELRRKEDRIQVLERLRPHWAQGYTSDSRAAQTATAALDQLWQILGANSQTDAVQKLRSLVTEIRSYP